MRLSAAQHAQLSDTVVHAAVTAVTAAGHLCPDLVRARTASALYPMICGIAHDGDGCDARRRSGMLVTLVESTISAHPRCRHLLLALERWLLHPGRDSAAELTSAAADYVALAPRATLWLAWSAGAGLDAAVAEIVDNGLRHAPDGAIAAVEAACAGVVSRTWVAQRCGVSRDALNRRIRTCPCSSGGTC